MDQAVDDKPRTEPASPPAGREARRSPSPPPRPAPRLRPAARRRRRGVSPLTLRILAVNVLALLILAIGLLYLDRYQQRLTEGEFDALEVQAQLIAGAL